MPFQWHRPWLGYNCISFSYTITIFFQNWYCYHFIHSHGIIWFLSRLPSHLRSLKQNPHLYPALHSTLGPGCLSSWVCEQCSLRWRESAKLSSVTTVALAEKWSSTEAHQGEGGRLCCFSLNIIIKDAKSQRQEQVREVKETGLYSSSERNNNKSVCTMPVRFCTGRTPAYHILHWSTSMPELDSKTV